MDRMDPRIFQRKYERTQQLVDDTVPLSARIESSHTVDGHTEYVLRVHRGFLATASAHSATAPTSNSTSTVASSWLVHRRYNDFAALHRHLSIALVPHLQLPAKRLFGNLQPAFVAERLIALQHYTDTVLMNPILASSLPTRRFYDPEQYNQSFADLAIQNASLCLRTEGHYALGVSLGAIGWRLRKHYFRVAVKSVCGPGGSKAEAYVKTGGKHVLVKTGSQTHTTQQQQPQNSQSTATGASGSSSQSSASSSTANGGGGGSGASATASSTTTTSTSCDTDLCLTWTEFGPDKYIADRELQSILRSLQLAHHPHLARIEYATANDSGAAVVRAFAVAGHGTVKDMLCQSQPRQPFLQKYGNPNGRQPLPLAQVALWSRQILEVLRWLHERGIPCGGHVHAGNVVVVAGRAQLLDVENFVLGVPAFYRPFFMQHSRISTAEAIDVYGWGHLVFEMAMGYALQESVVATAGSRQSERDATGSLKSLLDSILSKEACRLGMPSLESLCGHQFFAEHAPQFAKQYADDVQKLKPSLKLSTAAKEQLRLAIGRTEQRLQNEQKSTKNQKRLVKIQEMMSSEEEKKKTTKHKQKQAEKQQSRLRQQNSLQLSCGAPPAPLCRSDSVQAAAGGALLSPPGAGGAVASSSGLGSSSSRPSSSVASSSAGSSNSCSKQTTPQPQQQSRTLATPAPGETPQAPARSALLSSISSFNKSNLRRIE